MKSGAKEQLLLWRSELDSALSDLPELFEGQAEHSSIPEASRYVLTGGGKRLRGLLTLSITSDLSVRKEAAQGDSHLQGDSNTMVKARAVAVALEALHAASLVHDDLPALDDDDLRRGKPSCHKAFDEATAILTADALFGLALLRVASEPSLSTDEQARVCMLLSRAWVDLCLGQGLDIKKQRAKSQGPDAAVKDERLIIVRLKTGALFGAAAASGALCAGVRAGALGEYWSWGTRVGECFQALDDLDDGERSQSDLTTVKEECKKTKEALGLLDTRLASGRTTVVLDSILGL